MEVDRVNRRDAVIALVALGAAAGSRASSAQQRGKVWRVGFLSLGSASLNSPNSDAFLKGMRDLGYIEGKNLVVEWRFADGSFERLPGLAAELVQLKVDVIVAVASAAIGAAQKATTTIPIVMATTGDPVGSGFVKSLARPGGNITGLSNMGGDIGAKDVDLLLSVVPKLSLIGVLVSPTSTTYRAIAESVEAGAQKAGVKTLLAEVSTPEEIENAFAMMAQGNAGAVIVGAALFRTATSAACGAGNPVPDAFDIRESGVCRSRRAHELRAEDHRQLRARRALRGQNLQGRETR